LWKECPKTIEVYSDGWMLIFYQISDSNKGRVEHEIRLVAEIAGSALLSILTRSVIISPTQQSTPEIEDIRSGVRRALESKPNLAGRPCKSGRIKINGYPYRVPLTACRISKRFSTHSFIRLHSNGLHDRTV